MIKNNSSFRGTSLFILGVFSATGIILSFLYPDLWFFHNRRVLISHEILIPWESTYILVAHFFHGGIQLWDRFDQVNNAFAVLSNGVYGVVNVITAFIFIVISPFLPHPGQVLYHTHLFLYYTLTCLIRTIGGYVLLRKLVTNQWVIVISLIYLNTILTSYIMTPGIVTQGVYSFFPLLLYFILCFFEDLRLKTFLLTLMVMTLAFVTSPLFSLGYFYQVVHFFILSCGVAFVLQRGWRKLKGRSSLPKEELFKNIGLGACCLLIILPYFWWGRALTHDFYVEDSGLGGTQGRFNHIFNLTGYFHIQGQSCANPLEFLGTSLDYTHNVWGSSWLFVGASTLFLVLSGIVLSKDRRKHLFVATILIIILLNTAISFENFFVLGNFVKYVLKQHSDFWKTGIHLDQWMIATWLLISSIAHGINALTNPFSFLVRSFQMSSLLIPLLYFPLLAMGLESCLHLWDRRSENIHFKRRWFLLLFCALVIFWDLIRRDKEFECL